MFKTTDLTQSTQALTVQIDVSPSGAAELVADWSGPVAGIGDTILHAPLALFGRPNGGGAGPAAIAVTWNQTGQGLSAYEDGQLIGSTAITTQAFTQFSGNAFAPILGCDCDIDEVVVSAKELTAAQIAARYDAIVLANQ